MSLIAQQIANLLNGVSQRPMEQRHSSQSESQKNGFSHAVRGLMMRPPLVYLGKLTAVTTGWATAFVHSVNRDESERYHIVVANGDIFVYDAITPAALTVLAPKGKAYLTDSSKSYRAATAGDTTMIVNRAVTVKQGLKKAPDVQYEALVYIRQADYGTTYQVVLNDIAVGIKTISASSPSARESISTDKIATDLYTALTQEAHLTNTAFVFTLYGSTIHIKRSSGTNFTLSTFDGLSDKGLKSVKGSVQDFADLPRKAPNGFTVQIAGDPESTKDDYWVKFDDKGNPKQDGVWRECPAPGTPVKFDELTMPHRLVRYGSVLEKVVYEGRVGADAVFADAPSGPVVVSWAFLTPSNTAITAGTTPELRDHGTGVKLTLAQNAKRLYVPYRIDTSLVEPGNDITVTLYKNSVAQSSRLHPSGYGVFTPPPGMFLPPPLPGQPTQSTGVFDLSQVFVTTDIIEVKITYAKGVTPDQYRRVTLTAQQPTIFTTPAREIRFSTDQDYPVGTVVSTTIDGSTFNYTVAGSPATGATVAAGLAPLIDANVTLIATASANVITVSNTGGTYPAVTALSAVISNTTIFQNSSITMTVNEHVGRTLKNLTDGSSGTVTSNTAKTITVGSLTGGVDNLFKPGDLVSVIGTGRYFVFEPCPWNERGAGALDVVPFPSFKDNTISDVAFYQNRLGFTSNENIVFSASGDLFNFFRFSAAQLLPDDVIDVRAAHKEITLFHSLVLWNESLYGISDNAEWIISGEPALTPTTVRIDLVNRIPNTPGPRPVVNGNLMYLTRGKGGFTQVSEFFVTPDSSKVVDAIDITQDVPKYIKGKPLMMVGDDTLGILALVTDADGQQNVYIYSYRFDDNDRSRLQSSWSKWECASGQIVGLDLIDGQLGVVAVHSDGAYLHTIDLNVTLDTVTVDESAKFLDRQVTNLTAGVSAAYAAGPGTTTWTLPFNVATNGSEGTLMVVKRNPTAVLTSTRPAANQIAVTGQGDLTAASVFIGVSYEFRYKFSRIYFRMKDQVPETRGRLQLRYVDVFYHDTTGFDVVITHSGRPTPYTYSTKLTQAGSGKTRVPVQGRNDYVTLELVNSSPGVCAFASMDWEGDFSMRDRRI